MFSILHPCFEDLAETLGTRGHYQTSEYLSEYVIEGPSGPDFHRPLSLYLNEIARLGCAITKVVEPGLDKRIADESGDPRLEAYVRMPNFLIVAAERRLPD